LVNAMVLMVIDAIYHCVRRLHQEYTGAVILNFNPRYPMGLHSSTAAVLKLIRDGKANGWSELDAAFGDDQHKRYFLRKIVGDLESAGLIVFKDGRFAVTDQWVRIQGTLGISLTSLDESARRDFVSVAPLFGVPDVSREVADVFVLMSFHADFTPIYKTHVSEVVRSLGLTVGRADDFFTPHAVMRDVWTAVFRSRAVIADCTTRNPNVFYEIGMAHTVGKPVILITQHEDDVPFDLRHIRYIKYAYTPPGMKAFEETLRFTLQDVLASGSVTAAALG
jgi:hypothetical protein